MGRAVQSHSCFIVPMMDTTSLFHPLSPLKSGSEEQLSSLLAIAVSPVCTLLGFLICTCATGLFIAV